MLDIKKKILQAFEKLQDLPKPEPRKIGGVFYGSTELFHSVGNMLELVTTPYRSYGYGCMFISYDAPYAIKIGGSYFDSDYKYSGETTRIISSIETDLKAAIKAKQIQYAIIDVGTNFAVVGVGRE